MTAGGLRLARHRATTAVIGTVSPFVFPLPHTGPGVALGVDVTAGGGRFSWEPFDSYRAGEVTNPNMVVAGEPGSGKSSFVKTFLAAAARDGRRSVAVADPKGEYGPLADRLGLTRIVLTPGGPQQVNPLHRLSANPDQAARLTATLAGTVLGRPLDVVEESGLGWAVTWLAGRRWRAQPTLRDLVRVLRRPPQDLVTAAGASPQDLAGRLEPVRLALSRLVDGPWRGMFDGPSTVTVDPTGSGVVIDLSAASHDPIAARLVLVAATGWLQTLGVGRPRLQVIDEAWSVLADPHAARWMQSCWKLGRSLGVANIAVVHRCSDLRAQADDGTATAKIATGLLSDTQTRVLFRQNPGEAGDAAQLVGLTAPETELVTRLPRGRALWRIADRRYVVDHHVDDPHLVDTDQAMRPNR